MDDGAEGAALTSAIRREPLAVAAGVTVLGLWTRALLLQIPNYNYSDSFGPTLVELGQLTLVPDSAVTWFYSGAQLVLPWMIAAACRLLGVTPEFMHTAIAIGTVIAALAAMGLAASRVAGSAWAWVLAMIAIPFAWPFALSVGYSAPFWTGYTTAGYWGLGWTCAVWGIWFAGPASGWRSGVPFALAGVEFLAHPTWAIVTLSVLGLGEIVAVAAATERRRAIRGAVLRLAVALLIASPQILLIVGNLNQPVSPEDAAGWWPLIQFRKSFHYYLWDDVVSYARLSITAILYAAAAALVWPDLEPTKRGRTLATGVAIALLVGTAYVAMEVAPIRSLSSLVLTRSASLLPAVTVMFAAAAAASSLTQRGRGAVAAAAAWTALAAMALPVETAPYFAWSQAVSLRLPDGVRAVGNFTLSLSIALIALGIGIALRGGRPRAGSGAALPVMAALLVAVLTAVKLPMIPPFQGAALPTPTWNGVTDYLREQTAPDSLIVVPPYPYSIASARRSYLQDYSLMGAAVYNPPMTGFELGVLRTLYRVELAGLSHDQIRQLLRANDGILCLLERRYRELVASQDRVRAVKAAYPSAAYLVGFKPGVTPLEWSCGAYEGPVLAMPIAYQNDEYVIYDLRALEVAQ